MFLSAYLYSGVSIELTNMTKISGRGIWTAGKNEEECWVDIDDANVGVGDVLSTILAGPKPTPEMILTLPSLFLP